MTPEQLEGLVASGESETLELKETTGRRREATQTLCAMLNQRGGHVMFGVTPEGRMVGQQVSERTIEEISGEIQRIDPPAFPSIERIPVSGDRTVIVIHVGSGSTKPYQYGGTAYRRVGNTTRAMQAEEYNRMLLERMHSEQRWENQPAAGWSVEDLDAAEIRRTVEEAVRRGRLEDPGTHERADLLRGLGLYRDGTLWRAAVVLFGDAERIEFDMPQCLLRVARFQGLDRTEFLDNRQFHGNAFVLLKAAERFLRETLPIAGRVESTRFERVDEPLYPPLALREALANALCPRDYAIGGGSVGVAVYDDRLEVTSSGALPFELTPEKLFAPHESRPWNPLIARTFYRRGIIEEWGRGILKMAEASAAAGQPRPEIEDSGGCVTVRFRHGKPLSRLAGRLLLTGTGSAVSTGRRRLDDLTEPQRTVLALLDEAEWPLALREIHDLLVPRRPLFAPPVTKRQIKRALARLKDRGLAQPTGHGAAARWTRRSGDWPP